MGHHGADASSDSAQVQVSTTRSHSVIRKSNLISSRCSKASLRKESGRVGERWEGGPRTLEEEGEENALEFNFIRKGGLAPDAYPLSPFLYGTHYSTPGYVLFFLVRR